MKHTVFAGGIFHSPPTRKHASYTSPTIDNYSDYLRTWTKDPYHFYRTNWQDLKYCLPKPALRKRKLSPQSPRPTVAPLTDQPIDQSLTSGLFFRGHRTTPDTGVLGMEPTNVKNTHPKLHRLNIRSSPGKRSHHVMVRSIVGQGADAHRGEIGPWACGPEYDSC